MTALRNRERILDVREERSGATPFEFREDAATGYVVLRGYAATYEPYDCYGGPDAGWWVEQLRADSFNRTLDAKPDVMLLLNHTGAPLARTKSGTMSLSVDRRGLLVEARLDPSDPDVQALLPKMRRGDLDEMSFAFRVKDQEWNSDYTHRTIKEVSLQKGDVSVVNYGMNPNTQVAIAEGTVGALAGLSGRELAELRRLDEKLIQRAISNLTRAVSGYTPPKAVQAEARRALQWIKEGHAGSGFTDTGRKRASDLARGAECSRETIGRIANYLARHEGDKRGGGWSPGEEGYPSPGRVAWAAWGGDPAKPWTKSILESEEKSDARADGCDCWDGFCRVPGTTPCEPGSCEKCDAYRSEMDDEEECAMDDKSCEDEEKSVAVVDDEEEDDDEESPDEEAGYAEDEEDQPMRVDASLASSLNATLISAYALAKDHPELQRKLKSARSQLDQLRGVDTGPTEVDRQLSELRKEYGLPDTALVSEALDYIRREGTDPATAMSLVVRRSWADQDGTG